MSSPFRPSVDIISLFTVCKLCNYNLKKANDDCVGEDYHDEDDDGNDDDGAGGYSAPPLTFTRRQF